MDWFQVQNIRLEYEAARNLPSAVVAVLPGYAILSWNIIGGRHGNQGH
jgi:hypothetical protein